MGQCLVKCAEYGDFAVGSFTESFREGTAFRLRPSDGPLSLEEQAIDELLGPIFHLTLEARFGYQLCLYVFTSLTRVARLCLEERPEGPSIAARLSRLREVAWGIEELLDNFSSRGWLLRLLCTSRLDALVKWRLNDLTQLAAELAAPAGPGPDQTGAMAVAEKCTSGGGAPPATADALRSEAEGARLLAAGIKNARRLQEALANHLPSVMAPHGGAGDPSAMDAFMRRITPLVQGGEDPLRQLELQEEVQIAVASLSVGPHRALRHPDLQYFWWRHMAGLEEVPWSTLWPHLATFLGNTPRLSDGAGDTGAALQVLRSPEMVRLLQAAVHRMGYANYVNAAELDMAFGSGSGSGECTTLEEQLRFLMAPGRPILLARTSKAARAEGWIREAAAAAEKRQAAAAALAAAAGGVVTRQASAANDTGALEEEEAWYDAGSNFSRSNSSGFMSVLAGGDDGSGVWPGRMNLSRPVSQLLLMAGNGDSPRPLLASRVPSAGGTLRRSGQSANMLRHKMTSGSGGGFREPDVGPAEPRPEGEAEGAAATAVAAGSVAVAGSSGVAGPVSGGGALLSGAPREEEIQPCDPPEPTPQQQQIEDRQPQRPSGAPATATQWPAAPGLARLLGRDDDLSRIVRAMLSCRDGGSATATATAADAVRAVPVTALSRLSRRTSADVPRTGGPAVLLVSGPPGCGRTALVTAAADRLVASGAWTCAGFADVRCAAGPEEAALEMALALNVPFYAADRPAGVRLLSWLRSYGPQLRQGLVLDNVDLLLGLGRDEALEVARASVSLSAGELSQGQSTAGTQSASLGATAAAAGSLAHSLKQAQLQQPTKGTEQPPAADVEDRRRRVLRLLRDVAMAAPGLQLVLVSGPAVVSELLLPCMPRDLCIRCEPVGLMSHDAANQLLRSTLAVRRNGGGDANGDAAELLEAQIEAIVQAANCLPGLLRMVARAVRCDVQDLATVAAWASDALQCKDSGSKRRPDAAASHFASQLVSQSFLSLPPDARAVLCCLVTLGCPLEEEDVTAAAAFLGHPGIVRAGLCCLYDRGLLTFQDLNQRHDVVGHVRSWMLHSCGFMLGPAVHGASMAGAPLSTSGGGGLHGGGHGGGNNGGHLSPVPESPVPESLGGRPGGGAGYSRRTTGGGRGSSASGQAGSGNVGRHGGQNVLASEKGIRLSVLVQHLDSLLTQVSELYANGCRVAALRVYNNGRSLTDRALLLVPAWISRTSPSSPTAAAFAAVMCRHLNNICRHVLLPGQLARASLDLAAMVAWLPSAHDRLTAYVTAARAHIHLLALQPAARQLAAADGLASQLYPALAALTEASKPAAQPRAKTTGGSVAGANGADGGGSAAGPGPGTVTGQGGARAGSASVGGGVVGTKEKLSDLTGIPPQVSQLVLAHAEMAAANRKYHTAARHLEAFLELLAASGMAQSLEGAQARMQLGDLCLRRNRPPAEAVTQYEIAAMLLMQLYGQSHFRVGRAMLAAARCSPENQPPHVPVALPEVGGGGGGGHGGGALRRWGSRRSTGSPRKAHRSLEVQLRDCLYVQQLSQGKFNLDVAEVEVARGTLMCRHNQPDEALGCGLVALGIVLEILGDGTPQVAECLALVALALRQKGKHVAAAAIMQHAHCVRLHAVAAAAAASDSSTAAAIARPRPTLDVVLENLVDAVPPSQLPASPQARAVAGDTDARINSPTRHGQGHSPKGRTPRPPLRCGTLLQRSPIVQVPLPDGMADEDDKAATPVPTRTSGGRPPLLRPSPMLVVLVPGEDADASESEPSPPSPGMRRDFASRMAAAEVAGVSVRHVAYPPPMAPADSIPVGYDASPTPSPRAVASDAEWPPARSAAGSPLARQADYEVASPSAKPDVGGAASGGVDLDIAAATTARVAVLAASLESQPTAELELGDRWLQLETGGEGPGDAPPPQDTVLPSPATRVVSAVPSEMWADAPEDFPDAAAGSADLRVGAAAAAAEPDAGPTAAPVAVAAALRSSPATSRVTIDDQDDPLASSRTEDGIGGIGKGMQLPFPPPPETLAAASATVSSSSGTGSGSGSGAVTGTMDAWSTPVRPRLSGPSAPHLHPSPLTVAVPRYASAASGDVSDSPQPFSPGLSLPQPPLLATATPTSLDVSAAAAAAAAAAAGTGATTNTAIHTAPTSEGTPGSGTPLAQLSWSNYSPTAARMERDSRAFRGGIVFPTPSSTPGPSKLAHRAPWLSWATSGAADSSRESTPARELRFPDKAEVSGSLAAASAAAAADAGSAVVPGGEAFVQAAPTADSSAQGTPDRGEDATADGGEAPAEWALAANKAETAVAVQSSSGSRGAEEEERPEAAADEQEEATGAEGLSDSPAAAAVPADSPSVSGLEAAPGSLAAVWASAASAFEEEEEATAAAAPQEAETLGASEPSLTSPGKLHRHSEAGPPVPFGEAAVPQTAAGVAELESGRDMQIAEDAAPAGQQSVGFPDGGAIGERRSSAGIESCITFAIPIPAAIMLTAGSAAAFETDDGVATRVSAPSMSPIPEAPPAALSAATEQESHMLSLESAGKAAQEENDLQAVMFLAAAAADISAVAVGPAPPSPQAACSPGQNPSPGAGGRVADDEAAAATSPACQSDGAAEDTAEADVLSLDDPSVDTTATSPAGGVDAAVVAQPPLHAHATAQACSADAESPGVEEQAAAAVQATATAAVIPDTPSNALATDCAVGGAAAGGVAVAAAVEDPGVVSSDSHHAGASTPSAGRCNADGGVRCPDAALDASTAAEEEAPAAPAAVGDKDRCGPAWAAPSAAQDGDEGQADPAPPCAAEAPGVTTEVSPGRLSSPGDDLAEAGLAAGDEAAADAAADSVPPAADAFESPDHPKLPPTGFTLPSLASAASWRSSLASSLMDLDAVAAASHQGSARQSVSSLGPQGSHRGSHTATTTAPHFPHAAAAAAVVATAVATVTAVAEEEPSEAGSASTSPAKVATPSAEGTAVVEEPGSTEQSPLASLYTTAVAPEGGATQASSPAAAPAEAALPTIVPLGETAAAATAAAPAAAAAEPPLGELPVRVASDPVEDSEAAAGVMAVAGVSRASSGLTLAAAANSPLFRDGARDEHHSGPLAATDVWPASGLASPVAATAVPAVPLAAAASDGLGDAGPATPRAAETADTGSVRVAEAVAQGPLSPHGPAAGSQPVTPAGALRTRTLSGFGADATPVTPVRSATARKLGPGSAIPLPPSFTKSSQRANRSASRIPTPPGLASPGPAAVAATAAPMKTPPLPPSSTRSRSRLPLPPPSPPPATVGVAAAAAAATAAASAAANDPVDAAAWTLYSSPAFGVHEPANSPPRDGEGAEQPDGAISSPAARHAGSYTAAFLRARAKTAITGWGLTAPASEVLAARSARRSAAMATWGLGGDGISARSALDATLLASGATAAAETPGEQTRVPQGVKMHNPLFVSNNARSLGGDVTGSSYGFEHDDEEAGIPFHSDDALGGSSGGGASVGGLRAGSSGGGAGGSRTSLLGARSSLGGRSSGGGAAGSRGRGRVSAGRGKSLSGPQAHLPSDSEARAAGVARPASHTGMHSRVTITGASITRAPQSPVQPQPAAAPVPQTRSRIPRPESQDRVLAPPFRTSGSVGVRGLGSSTGGRGSTSSSRSSSIGGRGGSIGGRGSSPGIRSPVAPRSKSGSGR